MVVPNGQFINQNFPVRYKISPEYESINKEIAHLISMQIQNKQQLGIQVAAFLKGKQIINVFGGAGRFCGGGGGGLNINNEWRAISDDSLFMCYSVSKGVAATALAVVMDLNGVRYSEPVSKFWKEFAANQKDTITIEQAVSHRAGLMREPPIYRCLYAYLVGGKQGLWDLGCNWIANYKPCDWTPPGSDAQYHRVSWSWIIGGIVQGIQNEHISRVVTKYVARPLGIERQMYLGELPEREHHRVCMIEDTFDLWDERRGGVVVPISKRFASMVESKIFSFVGNSVLWKKICLPSSNGYFSATAVAKMYSDLISTTRTDSATNSTFTSTGSGDGSGSRTSSSLISRSMQEEILHKVRSVDESVLSPVTHKQARNCLGWTLHTDPRLYGPYHTHCLGHEGMGGCTAFADPQLGLSIAIFKNVYTPFAEHDTSVTPEAIEIADTIRRLIS